MNLGGVYFSMKWNTKPVFLVTISCCSDVSRISLHTSHYVQGDDKSGTTRQGQCGMASSTCRNMSEALSQPQFESAHQEQLERYMDRRLDCSLSIPPVAINQPMWWTAHPWLPPFLYFLYHFHFSHPFIYQVRAFHRVGGLLGAFFYNLCVPSITTQLHLLLHIPFSLRSL
jgi:hypothetical protein